MAATFGSNVLLIWQNQDKHLPSTPPPTCAALNLCLTKIWSPLPTKSASQIHFRLFLPKLNQVPEIC